MLFRRDSYRRKEDRLWATDAGRLDGVCNEVLTLTGSTIPVLVIAHFKDTLKKVTSAMDRGGIRHQVVLDRWQMAGVDLRNLRPAQVVAFPSDLLVKRAGQTCIPERERTQSRKVHVVIVEHYPIPGRDNEILAFARTLPRGTTVRFHASLEEPLLRAFGADRTFGLLSRLGWERTGYMANPTITRAIASGQARIRKAAVSDEKVDSQREWLYYNCPPLRERMK